MLGLIAAGLAGAVGYAIHRVNKESEQIVRSNNGIVAKYLENQIDKGFPNGNKIHISGSFDFDEVAMLMAKDGYNLFDYIKKIEPLAEEK